MSKHPVPKKKTPKSKTRKRYGSFKRKTLTKLSNMVVLTTCPDCGAKRLTHTVCPHCGKYRGRQVVDKAKKVEKITKIKA